MSTSLLPARITPGGELPAVRSAESGNLDLLRSVAVLLVLEYHLAIFFFGWPLPRLVRATGRWGVLIFFVHTSFVLMLSLERQARRSAARGYFLEFMLRRAFRLLPLSILAVLIVCGLGLPGDIRDGHFYAVQLNPFVVISNLLLVQNVTRADSVLATLWTLPYEVQMYAVLPALFVFSRRYGTVLPMVLLWAGSIVAAKLWMPVFGNLYDMPLFVPCFLAGVVGYKLASTKQGNLPAFLWPIAIATVSLVYLSHPFSITASWVCCLTLGLLIPAFRELPQGLFRKAVKLIARYSYGIYLSHFLIIWFAFVVCADRAWPVQWLVFIICVVGIPVALYHTVEAPMIAAGARMQERGRRSGDSLFAVEQSLADAVNSRLGGEFPGARTDVS
jgi:peptidoglycan/LPS O-acetylase OafA/YrhL